MENRQEAKEYFSFHNWPGLEMIHCEPGCVELRMPMLKGYLNRGGRLHGGMLYTLADMTAGTAVMSYGHRTTTVSGSMDYLRPGIGVEYLCSRGRVVKHGSTLSVVEVELLDQNRTLIATAHMTFFNFKEPLPGRLEDRFVPIAD